MSGQGGVIGRGEEWTAVRHAVDEVIAGTGRAVLLQGPPGIGKTALLRAATRHARDLGALVRVGTAEQMERHLPFSALRGCLGIHPGSPDPRLAAIARDIGDTAQLFRTRADFELSIVEKVVSWVDERCAEAPVVVALDDLQWADPASRLALHCLGKSLGQLPLLIVLATRAVDQDPLWRSLAARGAAVLSLAPLSTAAVGDLAAGLLGRPIGDNLSRALESAGGNPLYVVEFVNDLVERGAVRVRDGRADTEDARVSASLGDAVLGRLDFLSEDELAVLRAVALLGPGYTVAETAAVTRRPPADVTAAVLHATSTGVLTDTGGRLDFQHDLIRQALYTALPTPVREAMHLDAALNLMGASAPVERTAEHLVAGTPTGQPAVTAWLVAHGTDLVVRTPDTAATLLARAVRLGDTADPNRLLARTLLTGALLRTGLLDDAEHHARQALNDSDDPGVTGTLRWLLAQTLYAAGRADLAVIEVERALRTGGGLTPADELRFRAFDAVARFTIGDLDQAEAAAAWAADGATETGEAGALAHAYQAQAVVKYLRCQPEAGRELAERAIRVALAADAPWDRVIVLHQIHGHCLMELDRSREADEAMRAAQRLAEQRWGLHTRHCLFSRAFIMFADGRWDDALAEIAAGLGVERQQQPDWMKGSLHSLAALIHLHRMEDVAAEHHLVHAASAGDVRAIAPFYAWLSTWARACMHEVRGETEQALDLYAEWVGPLSKSTIAAQWPSLVRLAPLVVRRALEHGRGDLAVQMAANVRAAMVDMGQPPPMLRAAEAHCRGLVDGDRAALADAGRYYDSSRWVLFRADYQADLALSMVEHQPRARTLRAVNAALELYGRLGAVRDVADLHARARASGFRRGVRRPSTRVREGWDSLTPTERTVAALVAEGLSNPAIAARMFISRRTVQTHVSSVLVKLSLSSRVEVAVAAAGRTGSSGGSAPRP
ncbi:AAA family ATPase [Saccharothrix sp. NPDC042600]|uniref:AAA family ATPase n=1 Tax=Saccharothrix TaxID=2071 RepID=UPI0033C7D2E9|nr:LuxR family transcriptional regulator [Saccharothrix mutabilis subsp. capreolus]